MNKIIKGILFTFLGLITTFITTNKVKAEELAINYIDGVFFEIQDGSDYLTYQVPMFSFDGKTAFCIEPLVDITTRHYNSGDWSATSLTPEQRYFIEGVGYYGYDYPSHKGNYRYYLASQELIWKKVRNVNVKFSTALNGGGNIIDVTNEKNEILSLIAKHELKPSFNGNNYNNILGNTVSITDLNNVLSEYDIYSVTGGTASINGNKLDIIPNTTGNANVKLLKKYYDNDITIVYYNGTSQKLAHATLQDPVVAQINIKTTAGNLKIYKRDKDTGLSTGSGEGTLKGAVYEVFKEDGTYVTSLTTDDNGNAQTGNFDDLGKYYIKEKSASTGYLLDETIYPFEITNSNLYPEITVKEKVITREFEFIKLLGTDKTGIILPEVNANFGIYNNNGELIRQLTTDKYGKMKVSLPYGKYTLKQITGVSGHEMLSDYSFEVKEIGDTVTTMFTDNDITARLKVIKIDKDSKKVIKRANIKFKIYDIDNNEYVKQTITYPFSKTIDTFETNENGVLMTPYPLHSGHYKLEEVEQSIDGYLWNKESIDFYIGDKSTFITDNEFGVLFEVRFENKQVKGEVEVKKLGEEMIIENNSFKYKEIELENIQFDLYAGEDIISGDGTIIYEKNELIGSYSTNNNGVIKIEDLYLGQYYLIETKTNSEHVLDKEKHYFELKYKDSYTEIVSISLSYKNYLKKGSIEISKVDISDDKPLPNTKIEVYTKNDELIFSGKTDKEGKISIDNLKEGLYYFVEKEAPEGYTLNDEKMYFEISNNKTTKCTLKDKKIKSIVKIHKVDQDNNALKGVKIGIYDLENKLLYSNITDENGYIELELEYGSYYFKEIETIEGYSLNDEKVYFDVRDNNVVIEKSLINKKIEVPNTYKNEFHFMKFLSIGLILIGGVFIYEKNKSNFKK